MFKNIIRGDDQRRGDDRRRMAIEGEEIFRMTTNKSIILKIG